MSTVVPSTASAARPDTRIHRIEFAAIGTGWSVSTATPISSDSRRHIDEVLEDYDVTWSRFRSDSVVTALARDGGTVDLGPHAPDLLGVLLKLEQATAGAMTPLVGVSLEHLGYGADYRMRPKPGGRPAPPIGAPKVHDTSVTATEPVLLDVGSAGKGQLVDLVAAELDSAGHRDYLVDGGRDLRATGDPVLTALEHPFDPSRAIGIVGLHNAALCGSAVNRSSWPSDGDHGQLHHVLDGRSGVPVRRIAATWVVARSAMVADALSTALFFAEPDRLTDLADASGWGSFSYVRMSTAGQVEHSADLPGEVFR